MYKLFLKRLNQDYHNVKEILIIPNLKQLESSIIINPKRDTDVLSSESIATFKKKKNLQFNANHSRELKM